MASALLASPSFSTFPSMSHKLRSASLRLCRISCPSPSAARGIHRFYAAVPPSAMPIDEGPDRDPILGGGGGEPGLESIPFVRVYSDEWGEKVDPEAEELTEPDSPIDEDEWGGDSALGNGAPKSKEKLGELKGILVDSFYATELGIRATSETRAEILELVNQLEALNPNPRPTESPELLDGKWVLLYTAFSELLPLLAIGTVPLFKVKEISQTIDSRRLTIVNATKLSSQFSSISFSATASFEVRTPSRIQVEFTEGTFQPPEITSLDLPNVVDIFGHKIDLHLVRQFLNPLQEALARISRVLSGYPPLKIRIPGPGHRRGAGISWLLITYVDEDLRISRGDGGLFILAREGSSLLDQLVA